MARGTRLLLLVALAACRPYEPPAGFGKPEVVDGGLVDVDEDGNGDIPLEFWCPEPVLESPGQWYKSSRNIADAVGFESAYSFRLRADGEIPLCLNGERSSKPLRWACWYGDVEVYGSGALRLFADSQGRLATVEWLGTKYDESGVVLGEEVYVTSAVGDSAEVGLLHYSECQ